MFKCDLYFEMNQISSSLTFFTQKSKKKKKKPKGKKTVEDAVKGEMVSMSRFEKELSARWNPRQCF